MFIWRCVQEDVICVIKFLFNFKKNLDIREGEVYCIVIFEVATFWMFMVKFLGIDELMER